MNKEETRLSYKFTAYGHPNILANHVKTLEFTKDNDLTERGDCIIGIKSDFEKAELKKFKGKIKLICSIEDPETGETISSEFKAKVNPEFDSEHELVLRKSHFQSERTFAFNLNRGSNWLDRRIVEILKNPNSTMEVEIVEGWF